MKSAGRQGRAKLRFGMVGAGAIAQSYAEAFERCSEARLVAVADCRIDAAQRLAERMRCQSYDCAKQMMSGCELDAAIVCTPPVSHPDISIQLLDRNIHVLCEKPFSIDTLGAHKMLQAAKRTRTTLTMASKFRHVEDVVRAKSMIASGVLGELTLFENVFAQRVDMSSRWNSRLEISGGGVLIDNGAHAVDLMHYFLGPLAEVHALEGRRSQGLAVEETVSLSIRSAGGVICNVVLSWSMTKKSDRYLNIYGTRGAISIGWKRSSYLNFAHGEWRPFGRGYNKIQAFRRQLDNFSRAIRGEEPLLITSDDGLASVSIIESAYQALRQNQWVAVSNLSTPPDNRRSIN
jgi:predicted dehydrogenase